MYKINVLQIIFLLYPIGMSRVHINRFSYFTRNIYIKTILFSSLLTTQYLLFTYNSVFLNLFTVATRFLNFNFLANPPTYILYSMFEVFYKHIIIVC